MGNKRQNKKRNRSSKSSDPDSMEKDSKKPKSVKYLLSQNIENSPQVEKKSMDDQLSSPDVSTPKTKLSFDEVVDTTISIDESAPKWAKDLITTMMQLKTDIRKISEMSKNTQKTIKKVMDDNIKLCANVNTLSEQVDRLEMEDSLLRTENTDLKEKLLLLEFHQRRNNLVFSGIEESSADESGFDCYNKIMNCLSNIPDLDLGSIRIDRCHRLGPKAFKKHRDIIAKFHWYGDLVSIMRNREFLLDHVFANEDYPEEWLERRSLLRPIFKCAREVPKFKYKVRMVRDKLIIDGKSFSVAPINNLHELLKEILPSETCERRDLNTIVFLGPHSVFSNFHQANFKDGGVKYNCAEQMIQAEKAALFNDRSSLEKIMKAVNPYKIKAIGSRIHGFDKDVWKTNSRNIVHRAVQCKFGQNPLLAKLLKSTGSLLLAESSPDKIWGTGVHLHSVDCLNRKKWSGPGLMSEILNQVRSSISI